MIPYRLGKTVTFKLIDEGGGGGGGADLEYQGLEMHHLPTKLEYDVGELLSFEGMELYALYLYNEETYMKDVSHDATASVPEGTAVTEDMTSITFTYTEQGLTYTVSYSIEVFSGYSWARNDDAKIVEAMTKAYNGEIDISEYFHAGDVREVELTDGRTIHLVLKANVNNIKATSTDSHGATNAKFLVTMQEYFQGYSEIYYYGQNAGISSLGELRIPKKTERAWESYSFYDLIPTTLKPIFRLFGVTAYTTNGNYKLVSKTGNIHFAYYSGYWFGSTKGSKPSGYYNSTWYDSSTWGTSKTEDEIPEFVDIDDSSHKAKYIAGLFSESSDAANAYNTGYVGIEDNWCYVDFKKQQGRLYKAQNNYVSVTVNDLGVSFVGMI